MSAARPSFQQVEPILADLLGEAPVAARPVYEGAYSSAGRWVVSMPDGSSAFVKAQMDPSPLHGVAIEHLVASNLDLPCVPREIAYRPDADGAPHVIVLEDLSAARWGPPVSASDAVALRVALAAVSSAEPIESLPLPDVAPGWVVLREKLDSIASSGLASLPWIEANIGTLAEAEAAADLSGSAIVKLDTWLQNWCRFEERGAVLVDWAWTALGNPEMARAWGEASVRAAGGPPGLVMEPGHPEWAAWMAGQTVCFLLERDGPVPERLDETERREASATLRWACEELGIEPPVHADGFMPEGPWRP